MTPRPARTTRAGLALAAITRAYVDRGPTYILDRPRNEGTGGRLRAGPALVSAHSTSVEAERPRASTVECVTHECRKHSTDHASTEAWHHAPETPQGVSRMSTHEQDPSLSASDQRTGSIEELLRDVTILDAKTTPTLPSVGSSHITECEGCWELTPHVDRNGLCEVCASPRQVHTYLRTLGGDA